MSFVEGTRRLLFCQISSASVATDEEDNRARHILVVLTQSSVAGLEWRRHCCERRRREERYQPSLLTFS